MKISSGDQDPPSRDESKAWPCLVTNLLVAPGLGSLMAGRKAGWFQLALALAGFGITLVALVRIVLAWTQEFQLPDDPGLYLSALVGLLIFLLAWIWSLATSLSLFRERKPPRT